MTRVLGASPRALRAGDASRPGDLSAVFERRESAVRSYSRSFPKVFRRASGSYVYGCSGERYLDFLTGCSTLNYGHNHPVLKAALLEYVGADGLTCGLDLFTHAKALFLEAFERLILAPRKLDYVVQFPGPTGANAVEAALKLARKITGRTNVIAFTNAFHGVTLGALACTGNRLHRLGGALPLGPVTRMPYDGYCGDGFDSADYLEQMLTDPSSGVDPPAAIIVETIQGEGGLNAARTRWLQRVERIARSVGALLVIDDIQAGIGRTGTFFSFEPARIRPDIVTLAKSLSGYGLPLSVVLIHRQHDRWNVGEHNGTFRGNCPAFVTGAAALEHFWKDDEFSHGVSALGVQLRELLDTLAAEFPGVRSKGRGMMQGLAMTSGEVAERVVQRAFARGLIIETSGPHGEVVKVLAPLTISPDELDSGMGILREAVAEAMRLERAH